MKMSSSSKKPAYTTHTGAAFKDFVYDLLTYAIPKYGYVWTKPKNYKRRTWIIFREAFGDVVILYRNRNSQGFDQRFSTVNGMDGPDDFLLYVARLQERIFKGGIPLMEFIAYCAFLLDMALICFQLEDPDLINYIVADTMEIFRQNIQPYFTVVGGWFALYRMALQYVKYVNFKPQSNPSISDTEDESVRVHELILKLQLEIKNSTLVNPKK